MNTLIKRVALAIVALIVVVAIAVAVMVQLAQRKLERRIELSVAAVDYRSDAASVERGRYLFLSRGCGDCHGRDGGGRVVVDEGGMYIRAPNISPAPKSAIAAYTPVDWVRTVRHGVKPDGRPVIIMPSEEYARLDDNDFASLVAYVRQLPAASGPNGEVRLPLPVKVLYTAGVFRDASEKIDHSLAPAAPIPEGVTDAHGAYVVNGCKGCHGAHLDGGKIPGAPPAWPPAAKLSRGPGSVLDRYPTPESFLAMLKTGKRPDGSSVSEVMPFSSLKEYSEVDARALYLHLRSMRTDG